MFDLIVILIAIICFFAIKYGAYRFTENVNFPKFIEYQPYDCYKCCSFWANNTFFISIGLCLDAYLFMAVGLTFTILDSIAMLINENKNFKK